MESILTSIKKLLGITEEYEQFDTDIIIHINSVFMILNQLGVGPSDGFSIKDKSATWSDFMSEDDSRFASVKSYMYLKVRLLFDPPSSSVADSMKQMINEYEWRLNVSAESTSTVKEG